MEFLRKLIVQTQTHLKGLTISQRLAIGSCVALIAIAFLWMADWASKSVLEPLLYQAMTPQEIASIEQHLSAMGIEHEVKDNMVMVPPESRPRLLAQLSQSSLLPKDISMGFTEMMKQSSPWLNMAEQDRRWGVALGNELARVAGQIDGIKSARVFIDKNVRRTLGRNPMTPTASVFVTVNSGVTLDRNRVSALATLVSAAVAGLDASNVRIVDATNGRSYEVPKAEDRWAFDDLEDRANKEEYFANKIKDLLASIPNILVAVHAELDPESRLVTQQLYGKPVPIFAKEDTTSRDGGSSGTGPGIVPNTARAIGGAGGGSKMRTASTEEKFDAKVDTTVTTTEAPRHGLKSLAASVNVPRSYCAQIYKQNNDGKEPTDEELEGFIRDAELAKIKRQVMTALDIEDPARVAVDWFPDGMAVILAGEVMEPGAGESVMDLVQAYGGKAGLGALAVMSLFMMLMMVRRGGGGPMLPGEDSPKRGRTRSKSKAQEPEEDPERIGAGIPVVGEAGAIDQLLVGKEIDSNVVRTQQIVAHVSEMVDDDPTASVNILQQWIEEAK